MRLTPEAIDDMFSYHKPKDTGVTAQHEAVRAAIRSTAHRLVDVCGSVSGELVLAIRALQTAMFYANAHIAINQGSGERPLDPESASSSITSQTPVSESAPPTLNGSNGESEEKQNMTGGDGSENQTTSLAS